MHISKTLVGASLKATVCESLFPPPLCFSQIWYAGVWCGQDHHTSRGPKDEPQFPSKH